MKIKIISILIAMSLLPTQVTAIIEDTTKIEVRQPETFCVPETLEEFESYENLTILIKYLTPTLLLIGS